MVPPSKTPIPPTVTDVPPTQESDNGPGTPVAVVPTATLTLTPELIVRPQINAPASGEVYAPGSIPVRGRAQPGALVDIFRDGILVATIPAQADGIWQGMIVLEGTGEVTLVASALGPDGTSLQSDAVTITLAPPVQPQTGGADDPKETGRTFTVLLALLLAAGGFSTYFAGRLVFMLAKDRVK
jgi:hypothetical protein